MVNIGIFIVSLPGEKSILGKFPLHFLIYSGNHSCDKQTWTPWILGNPPLLLAVLVSQGEGQGSLRVFPDIHGGKVHGADVEVGDSSCETWTGAIRDSLDIGKWIILGINTKKTHDMVYLTMMGFLLDMGEMPTQSEKWTMYRAIRAKDLLQVNQMCTRRALPLAAGINEGGHYFRY